MVVVVKLDNRIVVVAAPELNNRIVVVVVVAPELNKRIVMAEFNNGIIVLVEHVLPGEETSTEAK